MSSNLISKDKNDELNNFNEYDEYYLIKENNIYKFIIETKENELFIKHKHYSINMNKEELSVLTKYMFNTINDAYEYIINIFDDKKVVIKDIINNKTISILLKIYILNKEKL